MESDKIKVLVSDEVDKDKFRIISYGDRVEKIIFGSDELYEKFRQGALESSEDDLSIVFGFDEDLIRE